MSNDKELLPDISHETKATDTVFTGHIFDVKRKTIFVHDKLVLREIVTHAPVVYIMVHFTEDDTYIVEREYRSGVDKTCYGLPAGMIDENEDPVDAAVRELHEETGVIIDKSKFVKLGQWDSSQGFTDETAHVFRVDVGPDGYKNGHKHFDRDEVINSARVPFATLLDLKNEGKIAGAVSVSMILDEAIRRAGLWAVMDKARHEIK